MKLQQFYEPQSGKFVRQLHGVVNFAYDLHLGFSIDRWNHVTKGYNGEKVLQNSFSYGVPLTLILNMKYQQFCEPKSGKLVRQLPRGVSFAQDPHLGHLRDYWKGIAQKQNIKWDYTMPLDIVYNKYYPIICNDNNFQNLEVVSWYVNFRRA